MRIFLFLSFCLVTSLVSAQNKWSKDGNSFQRIEGNAIVQYALPSLTKVTVLESSQLITAGNPNGLAIKDFTPSPDGKLFLIYTNSRRVWRAETRGDYYVFNLQSKKLQQLGSSLPSSSLMFAKFSPDGTKVAYVSNHNIYSEEISTGKITVLTTDGTDRIINGTFDWAYEEEFGLRDGFRWSPDSKAIAYWHIDARKIRNFYLVNYTDSIYSSVVPVEYPKVGYDPSPATYGVVTLADATTKWMDIPGDPAQHYLIELEWAANNELIVQQLNRKQSESRLMLVNTTTGVANTIHTETSNAWVDARRRWSAPDMEGWMWLNNGKEFLWVSEKDGWRHAYRITRDGKKEKLITKGNYDLITLRAIDERTGYLYFMASQDNATQSYLYRTKLDGTGKPELVSPPNQKGTHSYSINPAATFGEHKFSNAITPPTTEWVSLPKHATIGPKPTPPTTITKGPKFFKVTTDDGVTLDGWILKPADFDSTKKYPVVFLVYAEPASQTVKDQFNYHKARTFWYNGELQDQGYIYISLDNRGTPAPKGREWRQSIYGKIGIINVDDQANAAKKILAWPFIDASRVAVWGHSGGGSTTLNLLFRYPEIYKTGIALSPVTWRMSYDNIYEERYMGLPQENMQAYIDASAITHVKGMQGNLLLIHGTGDDNVHYQNTEMLINALVKEGKQFSLMTYPNRTHSLLQGEGTLQHLSTLVLDFLKTHCPPGGR
jgi:dipeptidyl-peptidase-4